MKQKFLLLLLAIVCSANIFAQDRVSKIRNKLLNRDESSVIVASHRGDWRNFPENSLEAIDNAIKWVLILLRLIYKGQKTAY